MRKKIINTILFIPILAFLVWFLCLPVSFDDKFASVTIMSAEGQLIGAKIAADGQWRFVPRDGELPDKYKQCLVMYEDKRFYYHLGIDPISFFRALRVNIKQKKRVQGGSTISMQTARMMRGSQSRTLSEKLIEATMAVRLELQYSKNTILNMYASHAPFGGNVVGIDAASWRYFGRPPDDLSWAEAATLAVLPNAPALIHPGRNRSLLLQKRNNLLAKLCEAGFFSLEDLLLAQAEPLPNKPVPLPSDAPHLLERLAKNGMGKNYITTVSHTVQQRANEIVARHIRHLQGNSINNMAAIIIENETGQVIAYVGNASSGANKNASQGEMVDLITSPRSTGSILKPFLYAAMLDDGIMLPNMLLPDVPTYINGFVPQNYAKSYDGAVAACEALERSLNIPSVLLLQDYGVSRFQKLLQKIGFTTISFHPDHYGLSLILGGAEVNLWETSNAYASMARTINRFTVRSGQYSLNDWSPPNLIAFNEQTDVVPLQWDGVLSAAVCWQIFNALSNVTRPEGETEWKHFQSSRRIAWKTGTSFGNRDAWAVGSTPQYTIGVWAGNASGEGRPMLTGINSAAPALFDLFDMLPPTSWFVQPFDEMVKVTTCKLSGYRATDMCPEPDSVWIANTSIDSRPCPYHILVHLDRTEQYRVTSDCEDPYSIVSKTWFVLPAMQEFYYKAKHYSYKSLPPLHPDCSQSIPQQTMDLLYPQNNFRIVLTKQMDGSIGRLIMQAVHRRADAIIYWHLDKHYLGSTRYPHQMPVLPDSGRHVVTLVDDEGFSLSRNFKIE